VVKILSPPLVSVFFEALESADRYDIVMTWRGMTDFDEKIQLRKLKY
jgi:hypothetical protein